MSLNQENNTFLTTLLWLVFVPFFKRDDLPNKDDYTIEVMTLSIIGLSLFELLFEARARYLFCYAPLYVMLAGWGIRNMYLLLLRSKGRSTSQ